MQAVNERRFLKTQVRMDAAAGSKKRMLAGYAAKFNTLSSDLGGFRESLRGGCFADSIARSSNNVRMLADHDSSKILGSRSNGTLQVFEDSLGLRFRCELPGTSTANDVYALCERGDLGEMSFGFRCLDEDWDEDFDPDDRSRRISIRNVKRAELSEVSIVTFPAYPQTSAGVDRASENPMALMAARNIFPSGVPLEVRRRFPDAGISHAAIDPEEELLIQRARALVTRALVEETRQ
jgi:uncharacterized protein